jgi:hypothetical protein
MVDRLLSKTANSFLRSTRMVDGRMSLGIIIMRMVNLISNRKELHLHPLRAVLSQMGLGMSMRSTSLTIMRMSVMKGRNSN